MFPNYSTFLPSLVACLLASFLTPFFHSFHPPIPPPFYSSRSFILFSFLHSTLRHSRYEISPDPDRHYYSPATSQLLKSLTKLEHARQLQYLASQVEKKNNSCLLNTPSHLNRLASSNAEKSNTKRGSLDSMAQPGEVHAQTDNSTTNTSESTQESVLSSTSEKIATKTKVPYSSDSNPLKHSDRNRLDNDDVLKRPLIIIIRHGKTEHNKLGLFTGM